MVLLQEISKVKYRKSLRSNKWNYFKQFSKLCKYYINFIFVTWIVNLQKENLLYKVSQGWLFSILVTRSHWNHHSTKHPLPKAQEANLAIEEILRKFYSILRTVSILQLCFSMSKLKTFPTSHSHHYYNIRVPLVLQSGHTRIPTCTALMHPVVGERSCVLYRFVTILVNKMLTGQ